jgi:hypothetical protein
MVAHEAAYNTLADTRFALEQVFAFYGENIDVPKAKKVELVP